MPIKISLSRNWGGDLGEKGSRSHSIRIAKRKENKNKTKNTQKNKQNQD